VTHGEEDQVVLAAVGRYTLKTVPGAKGSFYRGIGHSPFWEDSKRFNEELAEFVKRVKPPVHSSLLPFPSTGRGTAKQQ
jgi:pimeloyl-ACP methyl ester carboxylesterase